MGGKIDNGEIGDKISAPRSAYGVVDGLGCKMCWMTTLRLAFHLELFSFSSLT